MGQVLHGYVRTTAAVRRAIQSSQEILKALAGSYDINPKTVAKRRTRSYVVDSPIGPKPGSAVLSVEEEATIVAFRTSDKFAGERSHLALELSYMRQAQFLNFAGTAGGELAFLGNYVMGWLSAVSK